MSDVNPLDTAKPGDVIDEHWWGMNDDLMCDEMHDGYWCTREQHDGQHVAGIFTRVAAVWPVT